MTLNNIFSVVCCLKAESRDSLAFVPFALVFVCNLFSSLLNSTFIKFLLYAHCWKSLEISLLWVVVLSNSESSYTNMTPPRIVKLANAQNHVQLLATFFFNGKPIRAYSCRRNETTCHIGEAQLIMYC